MNRKRLILLACIMLCLVLMLSACVLIPFRLRISTETPGKIPSGVYVEEIAKRGTLFVTKGSDGIVNFRIEWSGSAFSRGRWEMTGVYNKNTNTFEYNDCVYIETEYTSEDQYTDKVIYTHGKGSFTYAEKKIVWKDGTDSFREDTSFIYVQSIEEYELSQAEDGIVIPDDSATPTPVPIHTPTPPPTAAPSPTQNPATPPVITKNPTDETLNAGGSCKFIAKYENAIWARWHFVSPDGKIDIQYDAINTQFPNLVVIRGDYSDMTLQNVPYEMNGWRVYCRYSNDYGSVDTKTALITVLPAPAPTATQAPTPTADPGPQPPVEPTPTVGPVVNEWKDTDSIIEATYGAGFSFTPPLDQVIPEELTLKGYRYRVGTLEADYADANGTVQLIIRKSNTDSGRDLSGDYNNYSSSWDLTLKGLVVHCLGNGDTVNTCYFDGGGAHFSISYHMGKEGQGLTPDQINSIVNCIQ